MGDDFGDTIDRDPDGPEYSSDYDAEPLSESEEESVLEENLSAEDLFYNERWSARWKIHEVVSATAYSD